MKEAKALIEKYKAGTCTPEEMRLIDKWLLETHMGERSELSAEDFEQISREVWLNVLANREQPAKQVKLWPGFRIKPGMTGLIAAAAVAAVVFGVWFFQYRGISPDVKSGDEVAKVNDIAPGKNGATITLANGKVIELSDAKSGVIVGNGKIAYYSSPDDIGTPLHDEIASIPRNDGQGTDGKGGEAGAAAQMLTASTAKGQTYQFTLPDGTKVWLNADSKISFPIQFNGAERKILLIGEGYFEVSKNKARPFIVKTENQTVTVLGTHFNISGYSGDLVTTTTLVEGSVRVSAFDQYSGGSSVVLKPNEQSIQNPRGGMQVLKVDVSEALDWKNGDFIFREEPLAEIMKSVGRWYNVDVIYAEDVDQMQTFSGSVSRSKPVSAILGIMQSTHQVKFKIEGRRVYVNK